MKMIFALILQLFLLKTASASTPEYVNLAPPYEGPRVEFTVSGGVALQTGYLTTESAVGTTVFGVNFLQPQGIFSFEWQTFEVKHDTGEFQLANNQKTLVSSFSLISYLHVLGQQNLDLYLGLGLTQIGLEQRDPDYRLHHASFVYSGLLRYEWNAKWSMHYKTQWSNAEQTIAGQETSFEYWNHVAGVGYNFSN